MGMLATTINSLALQQALEDAQIKAVTMTSVAMEEFADKYSSRNAVKALERGEVVILGGGSGLPFFSTDTAAVLRAAEIEADVVLMAKNIDGIYSADPKTDPNAYKINDITYKEIIEKNIRAYDLTATIFCMDNDINTYAFALKDPMNIYKAIMGENVGTETHN
jgi:uridylate kinase